MLRRHGHVIFVVDLGAPLRLAVLPRLLIPMSTVHAEHELVADLVHDGNVGFELGISRR